MKKVGFIGFGNMAEAIISGMISSGNFTCDEIGAFDPDENKLTSGAKKHGFTAFMSNDELVLNSEIVVLAVKPIALQKVLSPLQEVFCKVNPLVISIAAGQSVTRIQSLLGYNARIVRVMPNINAMALQAISGYTHSENVSDDELSVAVKILISFGEAVPVKEEDFSAFSAIAGCSPAYAYALLDTAARVGVKYGLTKKESLEIVTDTVVSHLKSEEASSSGKLDEIVFSAIQKAYLKDKGM